MLRNSDLQCRYRALACDQCPAARAVWMTFQLVGTIAKVVSAIGVAPLICQSAT